MSQFQSSAFEEGQEQRSLTFRSEHGVDKRLFKLVKALWCVVGKLPILGMAPNHFHGVEIRSVRGQPLDHDPVTLSKPRLDLLCPMGLPPVPDERKSLRQMSPEPLKESKHFCVADVMGILSPIKAKPPSTRCQGDCADGREPVTPIPLAQDRRLPARGPGTPNHRLEHKAALIHKDQASTGSSGVFLYAASAPSAIFRFHPRPSPALGAPASDNSSPPLGGFSIHARGDTGLRRCGR
jgi:hypothetical protein